MVVIDVQCSRAELAEADVAEKDALAAAAEDAVVVETGSVRIVPAAGRSCWRIAGMDSSRRIADENCWGIAAADAVNVAVLIPVRTVDAGVDSDTVGRIAAAEAVVVAAEWEDQAW